MPTVGVADVNIDQLLVALVIADLGARCGLHLTRRVQENALAVLVPVGASGKFVASLGSSQDSSEMFNSARYGF